MRKKIIFFIVLVVVCAGGWGWYLYNKPREDVSKIKAEITVDAKQLYYQYMANEAQANKRYLDKIIAVSGTVASLERTDSTINILLMQPADAGGVSCIINIKGEATKQVRQGESVVIKGRCTGFLNDVLLTDCVVEK